MTEKRETLAELCAALRRLKRKRLADTGEVRQPSAPANTVTADRGEEADAHGRSLGGDDGREGEDR